MDKLLLIYNKLVLNRKIEVLKEFLNTFKYLQYVLLIHYDKKKKNNNII